MKELASVFCRCFTHTSLRTASKTEVNESHKHKQPGQGQGALWQPHFCHRYPLSHLAVDQKQGVVDEKQEKKRFFAPSWQINCCEDSLLGWKNLTLALMKPVNGVLVSWADWRNKSWQVLLWFLSSLCTTLRGVDGVWKLFSFESGAPSSDSLTEAVFIGSLAFGSLRM